MPPCPGALTEVDGRLTCSRGLACLVGDLLRHQDAELLADQIAEMHKRRD